MLRDYDKSPVNTYSTYNVNFPVSTASSSAVVSNNSLLAVTCKKDADLKFLTSTAVSCAASAPKTGLSIKVA